MQIKVDFLCRDSILAAPIALDLVLFLDLAKRTPELRSIGIQEWLSFYLKSPQTAAGLYPEHDLFIQSMKLKNTLRHIMGEGLITHLGLEYPGSRLRLAGPVKQKPHLQGWGFCLGCLLTRYLLSLPASGAQEQGARQCKGDLFAGAFRVMLDIVHPQICRDAESLHVDRVFGEDRYANAGADPHRVFAQLQGFIEDLHQSLAHSHGVFAAGGLLQNNGKLVAACSRHGVGAANACREHRCNLLQ